RRTECALGFSQARPTLPPKPPISGQNGSSRQSRAGSLCSGSLSFGVSDQERSGGRTLSTALLEKEPVADDLSLPDPEGGAADGLFSAGEADRLPHSGAERDR